MCLCWQATGQTNGAPMVSCQAHVVAVLAAVHVEAAVAVTGQVALANAAAEALTNCPMGRYMRHGSQGGRRISRTLRAANLYVMTWDPLYD